MSFNGSFHKKSILWFNDIMIMHIIFLPFFLFFSGLWIFWDKDFPLWLQCRENQERWCEVWKLLCPGCLINQVKPCHCILLPQFQRFQAQIPVSTNAEFGILQLTFLLPVASCELLSCEQSSESSAQRLAMQTWMEISFQFYSTI